MQWGESCIYSKFVGPTCTRMQHIIYLVDDDEDDCFFAQQTLEPHANCELTIFENGQKLIDYLIQNPDSKLPTLILLDLNMPMLNGFETLSLLKQHDRWSGVPVVVLTTSDHQDDKSRCQALGAEGFLTKPADYSSLSEVLSSVSRCWRNVLAN